MYLTERILATLGTPAVAMDAERIIAALSRRYPETTAHPIGITEALAELQRLGFITRRRSLWRLADEGLLAAQAMRRARERPDAGRTHLGMMARRA